MIKQNKKMVMLMTKEYKDKYGNEYSSRLALFLGKLNNEVKQMDDEAKMIPVNISMKRDELSDGSFSRLKKVFSVFKRNKK